MGSSGTEYLGMYITVGYTLISMLIGGFVAARKKDFATRGVAVSMFAGLFGPLFMALDQTSRAREDAEDIWPARGPEAVILNVLLVSVFNYLV
ncbi:MAG: hypothetical protein PVG78_15080 [Desulfobacterales bacterium]|jgi:hypothetical protein